MDNHLDVASAGGDGRATKLVAAACFRRRWIHSRSELGGYDQTVAAVTSGCQLRLHDMYRVAVNSECSGLTVESIPAVERGFVNRLYCRLRHGNRLIYDRTIRR
jgi:hypothetical protein